MYAEADDGRALREPGNWEASARKPPVQQDRSEFARWFEAIAVFAPAPAFIRDGQGRYLWVNAAYAHLYCREPDDVVGRAVEEIDTPADAAMFRALDREVLLSGRPVRHTLSFRHPDGLPRQVTGHRFVLDVGCGPRVGGIYVDLTDHTRVLEDKTVADEELHALRERTGLAVVTLDLSGRVRRVSGGAAQLLGSGRSALEGSWAAEHLDGGLDDGTVRRVWADLVAGRTSRYSGSVVCRTASGGNRVLRTDLAVVRRQGAPDHIAAVLTALSAEFRGRPRLSPVQLRVLTLMAGGRPNTVIASDLGLSRQALDYHLRRLRGVLDAASRPAMVARAYALGILDATAWPPRAADALSRH
ncbi:PAS domain-containing protein [Streptomyces sp. So13.3]|uniref:PAS domain-containing protein n=1 Tax=Streptomyces TaxID=1883 RepID=UPI00164D3519|nr:MULTISPECIES: PAS domain-containing protein [Streptomyces]MCZ4099671.1 PAS domain-containing protein [Streptomyces sp. H39-C1]QNA70928.1 PAS domain-containing protein [Streptomyces sp. So13.3]